MIRLTEVAAEAIRKIKSEEGMAQDVPVRIGIKAGGCSGFTYTFDFDSRKTRFDLEFESQGMSILVDKKSHLYIKGTVIDWSHNMMDRGLRFSNPSARGSCGCGTSFIYEPQPTQGETPLFELKL